MVKSSKRHIPKLTVILTAAACGLAALLALLMYVRTLSPAFSDFICRYVARPYVYVVGHISSVFPYSVLECAVITVIFAVIKFIGIEITLLIKKKRNLALNGVIIAVIALLVIFDLYTLIVGFSYYRPEAPVPQSSTEYSPQEVTAMVRYFADDYNELADKLERDENGNVICPYTTKELSKLLQEEYKRLGGDYYYEYTPRAKKIFNSWWLTLNNISGITFVPLGEPTVNKQTPPSDIPQTMAHEMAHAKGVMREGEANYVSYYLLLSSDNDYLRYCGYFSTFGGVLRAVNANTSKKTDYNEIRSEMSKAISAEQKNASDFWNEKSKQPGLSGVLNRFFEKVGELANDLFLKGNGADNGTGSYLDKVTDGEISNNGTVGDDGEIFYDVKYSSLQKTYFYIYETRH